MTAHGVTTGGHTPERIAARSGRLLYVCWIRVFLPHGLPATPALPGRHQIGGRASSVGPGLASGSVFPTRSA